jgi:signal transduction histidine kinase
MTTELSTTRLLSFAKRLLPATSFADLIAVTREEVEAATGYRHVWFMVKDREELDEVRLIDYAGDRREIIWETVPVLNVKGDAFLEELLTKDEPDVIPDARLDPRTNKQIVAQLQNRTIVNIPLRLLDRPYGVFGVGTFGDEGCRTPTAAELDYLVGMAGQLSVAAARMRYLEERSRGERERLEMERRLLQLQKLESLGLLAGGIAHDFNNLLTVILSGAALAERATKDPVVIEELQTVIEAAARGRDVTRKLLAMSRQQDLDLRPLNLNDRLGELLALVRRVLPENIEVDHIRGANLPLTEGDASQIDQVFMNLCVNARDAMPSGGRLTIETEQVLVNGSYAKTHPWAKPGRYVLTTVADTGIGMARDVLDRIFDPFFSTKGPVAGTGLGLSIAYGIVRQHGGMLNCYSEPGVGTSFKVYLPAIERMAAAVGTKVHRAVPRATHAERVLIAEDDPSVRAVAIRILESAGYQVTSVGNGDEALQAVGQASVDLLILDVVMPGSPCRAVVERVRQASPQTRLLLASGYTAGANIADLLRETGLELLRKPYDPDQLLVGVRAALDQVD